MIISRELPPATYAAGGIGTYVANIARLLADQGDTVHVIGERWPGAPKAREVLCDGRLILHRIAADDLPDLAEPHDAPRLAQELAGLKATDFREQWFAWSAAFLAERLVQEEGVDVIEAQEWEAPLYYFLLRRSLGLGPERTPPCIVHLHSPSAFIHHFNGPPAPPRGLADVVRMEEFCIRSADALLCPSQSLAAQAARHYRLAGARIEVIPLPVGFTPQIARSETVWSDGGICFVGRLEPRKGVIEWVEAASRVAREDPAVHFDFVGADVWGLQPALEAQIGRTLSPRFRFHGPKSKAEIAEYLARARAGVVPSRWENFPNVCIEAMSSGLPLIATRFGGMAEMLEDGRSGWLATDTGVAGMVDSLAEALRRCLATPPQQLSEMGAEAAAAVRRFCDNDAIVAAHQRFRGAVAAAGARRSRRGVAPVRRPEGASVVVRTDRLEEAAPVVQSLAAQTIAPRAVAVVCRSQSEAALAALGGAALANLVVHVAPHAVGGQAWNAGVQRLAADEGAGADAGFWLFLDVDDRLEPDCLEQMARVFSCRPDLGVVTPWTQDAPPASTLHARPSPLLAEQLVGNDVLAGSGFRASALGRSPPFKTGLPQGFDVWALANAVMLKGWSAATLPCRLVRRTVPSRETGRIHPTALRAVRAEALAPFERDEHRLALEIATRYVPPHPLKDAPAAPDEAPLRRRALRLIEAVLLRPRHVLRRGLGLAPGALLRGSKP